MRERNFTKRLFSIKREKFHVSIIVSLSIFRFEYSVFLSNYDYAIFTNRLARIKLYVIYISDRIVIIDIAINKIMNKIRIKIEIEIPISHLK